MPDKNIKMLIRLMIKKKHQRLKKIGI